MTSKCTTGVPTRGASAGMSAGEAYPFWNKTIQWPSGALRCPNGGALGGRAIALLDQADPVAFRVLEVPEQRPAGDLLGTVEPAAAELLGLLHGRLDVVDLDVERHAAVGGLHAAHDAATDADAIGAVVVRVADDAVAHRVVGVDLPPEEITEELLELGAVMAHHLKVHDCVAHVVGPLSSNAFESPPS